MWTIVLISVCFLMFYIVLVLMWLVLGAIVSPTVFLPYATAAATFITIMGTKYTEIKNVIDHGFQMVLEYVE